MYKTKKKKKKKNLTFCGQKYENYAKMNVNNNYKIFYWFSVFTL